MLTYKETKENNFINYRCQVSNSSVDAVESTPLDCEVEMLVNIRWGKYREPDDLH